MTYQCLHEFQGTLHSNTSELLVGFLKSLDATSRCSYCWAYRTYSLNFRTLLVLAYLRIISHIQQDTAGICLDHHAEQSGEPNFLAHSHQPIMLKKLETISDVHTPLQSIMRHTVMIYSSNLIMSLFSDIRNKLRISGICSVTKFKL